jgi:translation initiation factor 2 subunit 2
MAEAIDFTKMRKPTRKKKGTEEVKEEDQVDGAYLEMLERIYGLLEASRQGSKGSSEQGPIAVAPRVVRQGSKKTAFINFMEVCNHLRRKEKHIQDFVYTELGTTGSLAGGNQLILKGVFKDKQIEHVLRNYITEYVACHMCGQLETALIKDKSTRAYEMQCKSCGCIRSVKTITGGFMAKARGERRRANMK